MGVLLDVIAFMLFTNSVLVVQMKTGCVALVLCLNISVDPPDVIKISPCARKECWIGKHLVICICLNFSQLENLRLPAVGSFISCLWYATPVLLYFFSPRANVS